MVAQTACVVCGGNERTAECVHLSERANCACVTEVVSINASCERGAGRRLNGDELIVGFATELFAHKGRDKTAEVRSAACTADNHIGLYAVLFAGSLCFKTDDRLVQKYLRQHRAENISVALVRCCAFNGFGNRTAERACCAGELCVYLLAYLCFH